MAIVLGDVNGFRYRNLLDESSGDPLGDADRVTAAGTRLV